MAAAPGDRSDSKTNPQAGAQDWNLVNGASAVGAGYPPEGPHPVLSSSLNPEGLVKALQRRWLVATTLGVICGALAATAAWFLLPPGKVSARALLRVASLSPYLLSPAERGDTQNYQRSQMGLAKSPTVLNAALAKKEVQQLSLIQTRKESGDPVDWLERELKVDYSLGPEILSISLSGDIADEHDLKALVDAITQAYLEQIVNRDRAIQLHKFESLFEADKTYDVQVRKITALIKELENGQDPKALRSFNEELLAQTKKELAGVRSELRKLKTEASLPVSEPKEGAEIVVPERVVDEYLRADSGYKELLTQKAKAEGDLELTRRRDARGENSPYVKKYRNDLDSIQARIDAHRKEAIPQIKKEYLAKLKADYQANQIALQHKIQLAEQLEKSLHKSMELLEKTVTLATKEGIGPDAFKSQLELQQLEELAKKIVAQKEALQLEQFAPARVTELDPVRKDPLSGAPIGGARIVHPDETKRKLVASGLSGFGTLGLILFVVAWVEYRPRRIHSVGEIHDLGLKLVGTVPALPSRRQLRLLNSTGDGEAQWQNILTESVDTARTMLLHTARTERTQVVMVTSATGGEGKTSLSSHLAASLARAGRKTLLLDCDLRNPALHRLFGTSRAPGLCEVLRGEAELAEVIWQTPAPGLSMIPAGRCDSRALRALAQDQFKTIAESLRAGHDFIVVDSAPILPVTDSLLIGQCVDAVIFSILHEVSRLPKVYEAYQRLEKLGIRLLGAVVSGTHVDAYAPEYQYVAKFED